MGWLNCNAMNEEPSSPFVSQVLLRQTISSFRLVIALFTVTSAITKILYNHFLPELKDYDQIRWTIVALGAVLFISTFFRFKRRIIVPAFSLFLYLATLLYVIAFVCINRFDPNAVMILILVYGASSVIINRLLYYGIQSVITVLVCANAYGLMGLGYDSLVGLLNLLIGIAVFGIVMTIRLKLVADVKSSFYNLEKLDVISIVANKTGEIVFISPSVKTLLGYTPKELLKNGWWNSENLREGWISRDHILNYPNIVPREILSMETSLIRKGGKKVWFNWVNSMQPNGNYMGIGLDVTRYKNS